MTKQYSIKCSCEANVDFNLIDADAQLELAQGGKNITCDKCSTVYWIPLPLINDHIIKIHQTSMTEQLPLSKIVSNF